MTIELKAAAKNTLVTSNWTSANTSSSLYSSTFLSLQILYTASIAGFVVYRTTNTRVSVGLPWIVDILDSFIKEYIYRELESARIENPDPAPNREVCARYAPIIIV